MSWEECEFILNIRSIMCKGDLVTKYKNGHSE